MLAELHNERRSCKIDGWIGLVVSHNNNWPDWPAVFKSTWSNKLLNKANISCTTKSGATMSEQWQNVSSNSSINLCRDFCSKMLHCMGKFSCMVLLVTYSHGLDPHRLQFSLIRSFITIIS